MSITPLTPPTSSACLFVYPRFAIRNLGDRAGFVVHPLESACWWSIGQPTAVPLGPMSMCRWGN
jgi:hypothetical protein